MSTRKGPMEDVKKQYVRMALESANMAFIARKTGVNKSTLANWVKQYRDEIEEDMRREGVSPLSKTSSENDIQKKYDHAMKLLGEKELEVTMLREMLKKKFPDFPSE
ncbi:transposase [Rossellomorea vietnamensis]|uniref:transposase n=1 Tax=Rossellomorea vietnamensis TaxID=218284 RepID=UPI003D2D21FD